MNKRFEVLLPAIAAAPDRAAPLRRPRWQPVFRLLTRNPELAVGAVLLFLIVAIAIFAPLLDSTDPRSIAPAQRLLFPSPSHWFGTDALGRDLYARVIYGGRVSLAIGFSVALVACVIGSFIGIISASGRVADAIIMRVMDGIMSIPSILLAIALMAVSGGSIQNVIGAISIVEIPRVARLVRGIVLSLRELPYIEAAKACGSSPIKIIWQHLLPATLAPLMVQGTFVWAAAMLIEAALSFIGAGIPPIIPSWGNIMSDGKALWQIKPYIIFIPAVFLSATVLAINLIGDGLRDILDPHATRKS